MSYRIIAVLFISAFTTLTVQAEASKSDLSGATTLLNAYGEEMVLEFDLWDHGTEPVIDYAKYGEFQGLGTGDYKYVVKDREGLAKAAGEGVYPATSVYKDPVYKKLNQAGKLRGNHWDFTHIDNPQLTFYKWATAAESAGVKQYFTAVALERAGFLNQALKAYHAVAVHFHKQVGWTFFRTPIYYARSSMDRIEFITRKHPELELLYVDYAYDVVKGDNLQVPDDEMVAYHPGRFLEKSKTDPAEWAKYASKYEPVDVSKLPVIKQLGGDHVKLVQFQNHHWQLQVDGKPFLVKAVAYEPTPVGESTHDKTRQDWMTADRDENGLIDGPYETWVDADMDNEKDPEEKVVGDFELLKRMGVNSLRHYHHATNKELLRDAYNKYGIMAMIGDLLGMYAQGSGADWYKGTDYTNPEHLAAMRESVKQMVTEHKDEPYLLMWVLSNEGNYGFVGDPEAERLEDRVGLGSNAKKQYRAMYEFANEMALMIKEMDPNHPVAFSNGETIFIRTFGEAAPDMDVFGSNIYRGSDGFGESFWYDAKRYTDKPVLITEMGCPAFHVRKSREEAEELQKQYLQGNWEDIEYNRAGSGQGNAIGGVVFQFVDEWWKAGPSPEFDPNIQETVGMFKANFPDGWMHEEWLGITSQGDGSQSPFMRQLRPAYHYFENVWNRGESAPQEVKE